jgi:thiamine-monophosphate kinase
MAERELIEYVRQLARREAPPWLELGIGDDAAVVALPGDGRAVLTTDCVVEGVHFESGTLPQAIGWKAMARGVSDLAAMAARPLCTLAAVQFCRGWGEEACRELVGALWSAARSLSAPLVGGDVASGAACLSVAVTAVGTPGPGGAVSRSGARAGDAVCVTGRLGGSILGRHLTFRPRVEEAMELAARCDLHAMIDVSDGLSTDVLHLAQASGAGVILEAARIPLSADAAVLARSSGREPLWHALNDGEDYELLFCLPRGRAEELAGAGVRGLEVSVIGEVTGGGESFLVMPDGRREPLLAQGWEHLR